MGDSTTTMGWIRRTKFCEEDESDIEWLVKQQVARKFASLILDANACLYKQWFAGSCNSVADSLSRDCYYLNYNTHKKFLKTACFNQLPQNFQIKQLPKEISCFITSILVQLPVKKQRLIPQKPSEIARGNVGILSSLASELKSTCSSMVFQDSLQTSSCPHSVKLSVKQPSLQEILQIWWKEQSMPPYHMWHRPFGQITGETPDWTKMDKNVSYSKNNLGVIETSMEE